MSYEAAELLDTAADHIERHGHIKGDGHGPGPITIASACILGALGVAESFVLSGISGRSRIAAERAIRAQISDNIVVWNDAPERTKQEVLDALRLAAKRERIAADSEAVSS